MPDVRLKDPHSDFVFVTGSPSEAAQLRGRGYTDVTDDTPIDAPQSNAPGAPSGNVDTSGGGTSTPPGTDGSSGAEGDTGQGSTGDAQSTGGKPASGKAAGARR